jgi:hypothetical protein
MAERTTLDGNDVLFVLDYSRDYHSRDSLFYDVLFVLDQHVEVGLLIY